MNYQLKNEAEDLASKLDNPCSVMIRKLLSEIEHINKLNDDWAEKYWAEVNKPQRLTEDEIREAADSVCHAWKKNGVGELYMEDFAKAILRKAQEK